MRQIKCKNVEEQSRCIFPDNIFLHAICRDAWRLSITHLCFKRLLLREAFSKGSQTMTNNFLEIGCRIKKYRIGKECSNGSVTRKICQGLTSKINWTEITAARAIYGHIHWYVTCKHFRLPLTRELTIKTNRGCMFLKFLKKTSGDSPIRLHGIWEEKIWARSVPAILKHMEQEQGPQDACHQILF